MRSVSTEVPVFLLLPALLGVLLASAGSGDSAWADAPTDFDLWHFRGALRAGQEALLFGGLGGDRPAIGWGVSILHDLWPLQASAQLLGMAALTGLNALALFALGRRLGLSSSAAGLAGILFVASTRVVLATRLEFFCEFTLLLGYLLVCLGYVGRARATSVLGALPWLSLELVGFVLGLASRPSFPVYLGMLVAIELALASRRARGGLSRQLRSAGARLAPHLILVALVLPVTLLAVSKGARAHGLASSITVVLDNYWALLCSFSVTPIQAGRVLLGILVLGALVAGSLHGNVTGPASRFSLVAFLCASLPCAVFPGHQCSEIQGYVYQPWAFAALGVAAFLGRVLSHRAVVARLAGCLLGGVAVVLIAASSSPAPSQAGLRVDALAALRWEITERRAELCGQDAMPALSRAPADGGWRLSSWLCRALSLANPLPDDAPPLTMLGIACGEAGVRYLPYCPDPSGHSIGSPGEPP